MDKEIDKILKNYNLGKLLNFNLLTHGFANENYKIETEKGVYHFRICKQQSINDIQKEIEFLQILKKDNFSAAYPISKIDDTYVCQSGKYPVIIYDFIKGEIPKLNKQTVTEIGKAVAKLNLLKGSEAFNNKYIINMQNAMELINQFAKAKFTYPQLFNDYTNAIHYLKDKIYEDLPKGFIHADVFPDNTIFMGNKLMAIIDFEDFCVDTLLFDVAMTINGFCFVDNRLDMKLLESFIYAYKSVRPLTKKEKNQLPDYILWAAVAMSSWHIRHDMLYIKNEKQTARVRELLDRYKETKKPLFTDILLLSLQT